MMFKKVGVLLLTAATMLVFGCGEPTDTPTGACTSTSCATGEICHPTAKVCVKTCEAGADCPSSAKTCAPIATAGSDAGTGQKICQCSTSQLCNTDNAGGSLICSDEDKVCVVKCGSNSDCGTGRTCDTATGQCKTSAGCTPACTGSQVCNATTKVCENPGCSPACTGNQVCGASSTCIDKCFPGYCTSASDVCNIVSGLCEAPKTCSASNAQPDTCAYGQFCSGSSCKDVAATSCANFTSGTGKTPVWDPTTMSGPIIFSLTSQTADDAFCAAGTAFTTLIKAYDKAGGFPSTKSGLPGFFYVRIDGQETDATASMRPSGYTQLQGGKEASLKVTLCSTTAGSTLSAGFYFTNGNEACTTITR